GCGRARGRGRRAAGRGAHPRHRRGGPLVRAPQDPGRRVHQGAGGESALPDLQRLRARSQRLRARDPAVLGAARLTETAGMPNGWLIETRGLRKRFGGLVAVDDLPLALRAGEVRGLIGPNGSGKTTTGNLLSGLYHADAGEIRLRGERIDRLRPHQITARGVARTFQTPKLFGSMTTLENVLLPALAAQDRGDHRPMAEVRDRARRLL